MPKLETQNMSDVSPNGSFFAQFPGFSVDSKLQQPVDGVLRWLFEDEQLARAMESIRNIYGPSIVVPEMINGRHLKAFKDGTTQVNDGFSDSPSGSLQTGQLHIRKLSDYVEFAGDEYNGLLPISVNSNNMAIAIFDPLQLGDIDESRRKELFSEVEAALRGHITGSPIINYSADLIEITDRCLVGSGFIDEKDEPGKTKKWPKPFDEIAWLKGLVILLGDHSVDHSGFVRQGAISKKDDGSGDNVIVAVSGQDSRFDEMAAEVIASRILGGSLTEGDEELYPNARLQKRLTKLNGLAEFSMKAGQFARGRRLHRLAGRIIGLIDNDYIIDERDIPYAVPGTEIWGKLLSDERVNRLMISKQDFVDFFSKTCTSTPENRISSRAMRIWYLLVDKLKMQNEDNNAIATRGGFDSALEGLKFDIEPKKFSERSKPNKLSLVGLMKFYEGLNDGTPPTKVSRDEEALRLFRELGSMINEITRRQLLGIIYYKLGQIK